MSEDNSKITQNASKTIQDNDLENVTGGGGYLPKEQCPLCKIGELVYKGTEELTDKVFVYTECSYCGQKFNFGIDI